jgi:hypothetical protein
MDIGDFSLYAILCVAVQTPRKTTPNAKSQVGLLPGPPVSSGDGQETTTCDAGSALFLDRSRIELRLQRSEPAAVHVPNSQIEMRLPVAKIDLLADCHGCMRIRS